MEGVIVSVGTGHQLKYTLPHNTQHYKRLVVVTSHADKETIEIAQRCNTELVITNACYSCGDAMNKGRMMRAGLASLALDDWLLFTDADCFLPPALPDLKSLDRKCLYYTSRRHVPPDTPNYDLSVITAAHLADPPGNCGPWGYFQLFHSSTARDILRRLPDCFCSAGNIDHWLMLQWPQPRRIRLPDKHIVLHLWHGRLGQRWNGADQLDRRWRFAGQIPGKSEEQWAKTWPIPCEVRRVHVPSLRVDQLEWKGQTHRAWSRLKLNEPYEYQIRSLG